MPTPLLAALLLALPQGYPADDDPRVTPEVRVVREVAPAVVFIEAQRLQHVGWDVLGRPLRALRPVTGSGVVIDKSGFIVTNFHVVGDDARKIVVQFDPDIDAREYPAELVSFVQSEDLALLKIQGERDFPVVRLGTSSDLMIGERVLAIGNPYRQKLTVSAGIISGLHRNLKIDNPGVQIQFNDLIQTDASINPGNSGGPLLNILGELVGINTAMNQGAENMGFAIPVDRVAEVLRDHLLDPSASRAWLGFHVDEGDAFCIRTVTPGGPADAAGIREGDLLLAIDGVPIASSQDYHLQRLPIVPNRPVRVRVRSEGAERELVLRGWDKAAGVVFERLGMAVEPFAVGPHRRVRVARVAPRGPAEALGLAPGDVIDAVRAGERGQAWHVHRGEDLAALVSGMASGAELWIDLFRDDDGDGVLRGDELYQGRLRVR